MSCNQNGLEWEWAGMGMRNKNEILMFSWQKKIGMRMCLNVIDVFTWQNKWEWGMEMKINLPKYP